MKIAVWLILALIWSTTWIFIKIGLEDLPPIAFSGARFTLSVLILVAIILIQRVPMPKTSAQWKLLALTGVLQFSINFVGPRSGFAGDDLGIWAAARVDLFAR